MANIGTVKSVTGVVKAIAANGSERILSAGDSIAENETIITGDGLIVAELANGKEMDLGRNSSLVIDQDILGQDDEQPAQDPQSAEDEVAALQQALADNPNLDPSALPATAAGAGAAGAENNGHSFISVDYLNPKMDPFSGFETAGRNPEFPSSEIDPGELLLAQEVNGLPSAGGVVASVDDEGLKGGIEGGTGDLVVPNTDGDNNESTFSGQLIYSFGPDGAGNVSFAFLHGTPVQASGDNGLQNLTSGGDPITFVWAAGSHTLTGVANEGSQGGYDVFTLQITDISTGDYTFTLLQAVDHPTADTEDDLVLNLPFTVTDSNGDEAVGSIAVTIDDDVPVNNETETTVGAVHEDALTPDGNSEGGQTTTTAITAAEIAALVSAGADEPVVISLNLAASGVGSLDGTATGLTQEGVSIDWNVNGSTLEGVVASGVNAGDVVFTLAKDVSGDDFTFTLLDNIDHDDDADLTTGEGDADTESLSLAGAFIATDTDGDEVIVDAGASVTIENDVPLWINPTTSHLKDVATSPDVVQFLNFDTGADGVGSVVFDTSLEGTAAKDALGNELTFNGTGEPLFVHFSDDGSQLQFVTKNLDNTLNTADVKFFIELNANGETYTVHSEGIIVNGTAITATNLSSVGGGNVVSKVISNLDGTTQDVVMTTATGQTVNTNNSAIGIGTQNAITVGEAIRFDFTNGDVTGNGGNAAYTYDGTHNLTTAFTQQIQKTTAGTTLATITLSAILADADNIFFGDLAGETPIGITSVKVFSGTLAQVQNGTATDVTGSVVIALNVGGTATIAGLQDGWIYQIQTTDEFSAVNVAVDAGNIKLGVFSYGLQSDGLPIELDYDIIGTDGDGDSVTGSLGVNLYPDGSTFEGTDVAETLTGTANNDYLLGRGEDDFLFGLGGDDLLIGGYGDDEMTGGLGKDSFVFSLAANSGDDIIKDFDVGTDALNFIDVLDLDNSNTFNLADAINNVSDAGDGDAITLSLTNGGSVTLEGIGTGLINDITSLQGYLGATNITVDES